MNFEHDRSHRNSSRNAMTILSFLRLCDERLMHLEIIETRVKDVKQLGRNFRFETLKRQEMIRLLGNCTKINGKKQST